ncbi:MAG: DUF309 domain-containing protein [Verrucomicrobiales bacterium]|nr:DUF309 domain-containing protein [Verrucomicrobiales bacterium]
MTPTSPNPDDPPLPTACLGYFDCFNRGRFFEAHDVLEEHWLDCRLAPEGNYFKALIQFAGVFVHLDKRRRAPAAGLCRLALKHLRGYPSPFCHIDTDTVRAAVQDLLERIEDGTGFPELLAPETLRRFLPDPARPGGFRIAPPPDAA